MWPFGTTTRDLTRKALYEIRKVRENMATQAEVNALTEAVQGIGTQLARGLEEVTTEIDRLEEALGSGETLDLTALSAAVESLQPLAGALDSVVPETVDSVEPEGNTPPADTPPSADEIPFPGTVLDAASSGDVATDGPSEGSTAVGDAPASTPDPEVTWPPASVDEDES